MRRQPEIGFTLLEVVAAIAIVGTIVLCTVPAFASHRRRSSMRIAVGELRVLFHKTRTRAVSRGRHLGLRFARTGSDWQYSVYEDGDGDGVRADDIANGIDRRVEGPYPVLRQGGGIAGIGLLQTNILDPDGDRLAPTSSPLQFNRSTICSFSPVGAATPGSIYLIDGAGALEVVRVYGATARIRSLRYDTATRRWAER